MIRPHYVPLFQSICHSEKLADLQGHGARWFYSLLLTHADAWGRMPARPRVLFQKLWSMFGTVDEVEPMLADLARVKLIERYESDGEPFLWIPDWEEKAGRVGQASRRAESEFPAPPEADSKPDKTSRPLARPRDTSRDVERSSEPPSRARAHLSARAPSEPSRAEPNQTIPRAGPAPATPSRDPPTASNGAKARPPASGDHPECIRHWESEWARTRQGTRCAIQVKDAAAVAWMLKEAAKVDLGALEVRRRMTAMLEDGEEWMAENASLTLLRSKWDRYAVTKRPGGVNGLDAYPDRGRPA